MPKFTACQQVFVIATLSGILSLLNRNLKNRMLLYLYNYKDMHITYIQFLYALVLFVNLFILTYLLFKTKKRKGGRNNNDNEGGIETSEDPVLDLPPGVILPQDAPVEVNEPV